MAANTLDYTARPTTLLEPYLPHAVFLAMGDVNGDGNADLLAFGADFPGAGITFETYRPQPSRLYLGDGTGGFTKAPASLFPVDDLLTVHPRKVLFADFNGDGRVDVYLADHGFDAFPLPGQQNLLLLSTPQGGWRNATATLPQVSDFTHSASAADIDRDGDVDIFVGNGYNNTGAPATAPYLLINDGRGQFTRNDADVPVAPGQALYMFPQGGGAVHFAGSVFSDLDRDGWPDLIVTAEASGSFDRFRQSTIFWNQGGRFDSDRVTRLPEATGLVYRSDQDAAVADFDQDGRLDVVLIGTNGNPSYDGGYVQVLRGTGNRQFADVSEQVLPAQARVQFQVGATTGNPWPTWVATKDYNGDGAMDFLVSYWGTPTDTTPVLWLNNGQGSFSAVTASAFRGSNEQWQFVQAQFYETAQGLQTLTPVLIREQGLNITGRQTATPLFGRPDDAGDELITGGRGNDRLVGGPGNDTIDGGAGLDWAAFQAGRSRYAISRIDPAEYRVAALDGSGEGSDTLKNIERLKFADHHVALDLEGNAGTVAKILGAVFGRAGVANPLFVGIGLHFLDDGMSYETLTRLAIDARLGPGASHQAVVDLLFTNLVGVSPGDAQRAVFVGLLDRGAYTVASLGVAAAETDLNSANIDLIGLAQQGLSYVLHDVG